MLNHILYFFFYLFIIYFISTYCGFSCFPCAINFYLYSIVNRPNTVWSQSSWIYYNFFWPNVWSLTANVSCALGNLHCAAVRWNVPHTSVRSNWSAVLFKYKFYFLIDLLFGCSGHYWWSLLSGSIFLVNSVKISFIH